MKKVLLFLMMIVLGHTIYAQKYQQLIDSCLICLERQDTMGLQALYPRIYTSYEEMNDEYYSISKELEEIKLSDQGLRLLYMEIRKRKGTSDSLSLKVRSYMDAMNRSHAKRAEEILNEWGWLTTDKVSEDANEGLFLMVQHCNDTVVQSLCLSMLKQLLDNHPAEKWHYAFLTDRFAMNRGDEQIYGTQKIVKDGFPYIVPLQYPDKVEDLRKEMGLPSLWEELSDEYGGKWNLDFYMNRLPNIKKVYKAYVDKHKE